MQQIRFVQYTIAFLLVVSCGDDPEQKALKLLLEGNEYLNTGQSQLAEEKYLEALKIYPDYSDALNNLGTIYFNRNNYQEAIDYYSRAIELKPDFEDAYFNRANTNFQLGNYFKVLDDLSLIINETSVKKLFLEALAYERLRKFPEAINLLQIALSIDSLNQELWINLGTIHYYLKEYDIARSLGIRSINYPGSSKGEAYNLLSLIELDNNNLSEAIEWNTKALKQNPLNPYFLNNKGFLLIMNEEYDAAERLINQSLRIDSKNSWAFRNKAVILYHKEELSRALGNLKTANELDVNTPLISYYLALVFNKMGDKQKACSYLKIAVENKDYLEEKPFACQ